MAKNRHCRRLGDHAPHDWRGHQEVDLWMAPLARVMFHCKGTMLIGGGERGHGIHSQR